MPGFETATRIVCDTAKECGLVVSDIADVFDTPNQNIIQMVAMLKPTGRELLKLHPWTHLQRQGTFNTAAGTASYALATVCADFGRFIDETMWNRTQGVLVPGSLTPQQWQQAKGWTSAGVYKTMRLWGDAFHFDPTPAAIEAIFHEYISRNWGAVSFAKEAPTAKDDYIQFDPHLFTRALKLRWLTAKGFDTAAALDDYNTALRLAMGQDGAAPTLSLHPGRRMAWPNIPETGIGQ